LRAFGLQITFKWKKLKITIFSLSYDCALLLAQDQQIDPLEF